MLTYYHVCCAFSSAHALYLNAIYVFRWLAHILRFNFIDNDCSVHLEFIFGRSGETGRRTGLKIPRGRPHLGSIPSSGTKKMKGLAGRWPVKPFFSYRDNHKCQCVRTYLKFETIFTSLASHGITLHQRKQNEETLDNIILVTHP